MRRVFFLMWKELIELRQDPRLFGVVIVAPILQLVMLGYAATTDVRNVPVVGWERLRTQMVQRLLRMKALDAARLQGRPVLLLDATGLICFQRRHCPHCLVQKHDSKTLYLHQVLDGRSRSRSSPTEPIRTRRTSASATRPT